MILVALTGGIGSGKSSVSSRLEAKGAAIIDADLIVKELQSPGGEVFKAMVERWGERIVAEDGTLARQAVADIVFNDKAELAALNRIVGHEIRREMRRRAIALADSGRVVVMDIPLLVESLKFWPEFSATIVVDLPPEVAIERLVTYRGFSEADARARVANQAKREDRLAIATHIVDNSGSAEQLDREVDELWANLANCEQVPTPSIDVPRVSEDDRPAR